MTRWQILAITLTVAALATADGWAAAAEQPGHAPEAGIRHLITPEAGDWLVCVQTFKGERAQMLAEQMADMFIRDYRLPAYLLVRGRTEKAEEAQRVDKLRKQYDDMVNQLKAQNPDTIVMPFKTRSANIDEEFAVLVGDSKRLKDMDAAHDFLIKLRRMPPPPKEFCCRVEFGDINNDGKKMTSKGDSYINPFSTAMPAHNPTIPFEKHQQNPEVADEELKAFNADEPLSVLKCRKPYTLVVKVFQAPVILQAKESPSVMHRFGEALGFNKRQPDAQAVMAVELAQFLRKMKPAFESYVLHRAAYSVVTVGQFDSPDDPNLKAAQRALVGLQLRDPSGGVVNQLSVQPLPMKIPR